MKRTTPVLEKPKQYSLYLLKKKLTEKQKRFCYEYVRNGWDGTKAYIKAYNNPNKNTAASNASQLLHNDHRIQQFIEYIKDDYELLCNISKAKQINEYKKIAYSSIAHLQDTWIKLKDLKKITRENPDVLDAIESVDSKIEEKVINKELIKIVYVKIKMHSKLTALSRIDKLMDYEAAEKVELSGDIHTEVDITKYSAEEKAVLLSVARKTKHTH